jgi:PAS domain S-box-containing protein
MMKNELHVLHVEDNEDDSLLILRALKKEGYPVVSQRVDTKEDFLKALDAQNWDVVLSDYSMPLFNGMEALKIILDHSIDPPFIIVSGAVGEERAVALLRAGADDYIRKDNLVRLGQAVNRALEQKRIHQEKTAAEKALIENEVRFKAIADYTHDWEIWIAPDGNIKWLNPAVERITSYTQEEYSALGNNLRQRLKHIVHKSDQDVVINALSDGLKNQGSGNDIHFRIITKNGLIKWCSMSFQPIYSSKGEFLGIRNSIRDISDRKKAEEALEASEKRYRLVFEYSPLGIVQFDETGVIVDCNENFAHIFSGPKDKLVGVNMLETMPDSQARDTIIDTLTTGFGQYEGKYKTLKGTKYIRAIHSAITDKDGNVKGAVGIFEDISEQIRFETHLNQIQKMESIGNLAGGIAHDFNNLLFPIMGISEMLLDDLTEGSNEHRCVNEILKAGKRGSDLVKQIMSFSRKSDSKKTSVRFQQIIKEALMLIRSIIPTSIEISNDINEKCGPVEANTSQLHQVVMNLITNAYHALENASGTIHIQLQEVVLGQEDIVIESMKPGTYAKLSISDTGTGIHPDILDKIFEPYYTTKEKGKGTGLGLSTVYGIIKDHQGDIRVVSEQGKGSVFSVFLPVLEKISEKQSTPENTPFSTGHEKILLVDDEKSIVQMEKKMLERLGYKVTAMTDSVEALKAFKNNPKDFDLIITDMTMPNMTGDQLAKEMITIRDDIPIIISTGYSERINEKQAERLGIKAFLLKPVSRSDMAQTVRNILDCNIR